MNPKQFKNKLVLNKRTVVSFREMQKLKGGLANHTEVQECWDTGVMCNTQIALCNTNSPACPW